MEEQENEEFEGLQESVEESDNLEEPQQEPDVEEENEAEESEEVVEQETMPQVYSTEELTQIIREDGEVDTKRLSPEGIAIMKAMQRGFTPKLEEAASIRRELEDFKRQYEESKPKPQPSTIEEAYDQNPKEVIGYIDGEIQRLIQEDASANLAQIEQLRTVKQDLSFREVNSLRSQAQTQQQTQAVMQKMMQAVPDLQTKQADLAKFAKDMLGYTDEELRQATSPAVAGEAAIRNVMRINSAYEKINAGKTVQTKQKQKKPTKVEQPGQSYTPKTTSKQAELKSKAVKGEVPWSEYFLSLEE